MMAKKSLKKPKKTSQLAVGSFYYNLVKHDATKFNKLIKWLIFIHYPLYILTLIYELITVDFSTNGYVGPASMIFQMSLVGSIFMELMYFIILTVITLQLYTSMITYKKMQIDKYMKKMNNKRREEFKRNANKRDA